MTLNEKVKEWEQIKDRDARDKYYANEIFPIIAQNLKAKEGHDFSPYIGCDYLIMTVGKTFEPLALSAYFLKPKHILFLYTEDTEAKIEYVEKCVKLNGAEYKSNKIKVDETNVVGIYKAISDEYEKLGKPKKIAVDFTGGTKPMTAAAAMAGNIINAGFVYVGNDKYDDAARRPIAGTEFMELIDNPYIVLGTLKYEEAIKYISDGHYGNAIEIFDSFSDIEKDNASVKFSQLYKLAQAYYQWEKMDFESAYANMDSLYKNTKRYKSFAPETKLCDKLDLLTQQRDILGVLSSRKELLSAKRDDHSQEMAYKVLREDIKFVSHLMFTLHADALRKDEHHRYDMASVLLYRVLEMIMQRRLATHGISVFSAPRFDDLFGNNSWNLGRIISRAKECHYKVTTRDFKLPVEGEPITLLFGYIFLYALDDALVKNVNLEKFENNTKYGPYEQIKNVAHTRNKNMFVHGFEIVTKKDLDKLSACVDEWLKAFCVAEELKYEDLIKQHEFIKFDEHQE